MAVADLLIGGALLYVAPATTALPADSTAWGTAWGGSWAELGKLSAPLSVIYNIETADADWQYYLSSVDRAITKEECMFESVIGEVNGAVLAYLLNGTTTTTAAGAGQVGKTTTVAGGTAILTKYTWGVEGMRVDSSGVARPRRYQINRGTATINGNLEIDKSAYGGLPISIKALADTTKSRGQHLVIFQDVTAPATS